MSSFPAFSAGKETWTVACDGQALMVRGTTRHARTFNAQQINSLIPLTCMTSAALSRDSGVDRLTFRVWDGDEYYIGVDHGGSSEVVAGLQALVAEVARINASWPMNSSRAAAARSQAPVGYLRDAYLLGPQGMEEFWSPLAELSWTWGAEPWQRSPLAGVWPLAAMMATWNASAVLVAVVENALVLLSPDGQVNSLAFEDLKAPELTLGRTPTPTLVGPLGEIPLGLTIRWLQESITLFDLPTEHLQPLFRYLLARWAENYAAQFDNPVDATVEAARTLEAGEMPPVAYASVLDAIIAKASDVPLSRNYPPRERDYLRPAPTPAHPANRPAAAPRATAPPPRQGVNTRQVAAGAVAGAALWNLFSG